MVRFIISLILLLASIFGAVTINGGNPLMYLSIPGLMIMLLTPLFAMLAVWRFVEIGRAFGDAFSKKPDSTSRAKSARIWDFTEKVSYATGAIAFFLAAVIILARLYGSVAELGRAAATALVAPSYGLLLGIVCRILRARVEL